MLGETCPSTREESTTTIFISSTGQKTGDQVHGSPLTHRHKVGHWSVNKVVRLEGICGIDRFVSIASVYSRRQDKP